MTGTWDVNTSNTITAISDSVGTVTAEYFKEGEEDVLVSIVGDFIAKGNGVYVKDHTFTDVGDYMIVLTDSLGRKSYVQVAVVPEGVTDIVTALDDIKGLLTNPTLIEAQDGVLTKLDSVESGIKQLLANIVDEVNENQTIIETDKIKFTVTI